MPTINTLPLGLLGFLGIKNGGRYPDELGSLLVPTWDLMELYTAANSVHRNDNVNVTAVGAFTVVTVPEGEAWYVINQDVGSATLAAGVTLQLSLQITDPSSIATVALSDPTNLASAGQRCSASLPRPYFAGPGSALGLIATVWGGGVTVCSLSTRYARFQL